MQLCEAAHRKPSHPQPKTCFFSKKSLLEGARRALRHSFRILLPAMLPILLAQQASSQQKIDTTWTEGGRSWIKYDDRLAIQKKSGLCLVALRSWNELRAGELFSIVEKVNALLPEGKKTALVLLDEAGKDSVSQLSRFSMSYYSCYNGPNYQNMIYGMSDVLSDSLATSIGGHHEQFHAYFEHAGKEKAKVLLARLYEKAFSMAITVPFRMTSARQLVESMPGNELVDRYHPVFSVFDESNYFALPHWGYGHPYDKPRQDTLAMDSLQAAKRDCWKNAHELFASASNVMMRRPWKIIARLQEQEEDAPGAALLNAKIGLAVLRIWGNDAALFFIPGLKGELEAIRDRLEWKKIERDIEGQKIEPGSRWFWHDWESGRY